MANGGQVMKVQLSKTDTAFFKGAGILLIALHNFFHWVPPSPGENEFSFDRRGFVRFFEMSAEAPAELFNLLLSYFGHYGVQVFVFLSAYGIARSSMESKGTWLAFMRKRARRLYPTFLIAIAVHAVFVLYPWDVDFPWMLKAYLLRLSMLSNFWPGMQLSLVGPWWFFSLVFQFYAVYRLLDRVFTRFGGTGLLVTAATALLVTAALNPLLLEHGQNLFFTVIGHLPVLCLGMYAAHAGLWLPRKPVLCAIAVVFCVGNWFGVVWYLAPLCATILLTSAMSAVQGRLGSSRLGAAIRHLGDISLPLFAIHGMLRGPFVELAREMKLWYVTLALGVAFLAWSILVAELAYRLEARLTRGRRGA